METRLDLTTGPTLHQQLADALKQFIDEHQIGAEVAYALQLAVEEIAVNIWQHGYRGVADQPLTVIYSREADRVSLTFIDQAEPFNPLQDAPTPDLESELEEREIGGLGIHLISQMMDDVHYQRDGNQNRLILVKRVDA